MLTFCLLQQSLHPYNEEQRDEVDTDKLLAAVGAEAEVKGGKRHAEFERPGADHIEANPDPQARHILEGIAPKGKVDDLQHLVHERELEPALGVAEEQAATQDGEHI